jgi:hypothetical protein
VLEQSAIEYNRSTFERKAIGSLRRHDPFAQLAYRKAGLVALDTYTVKTRTKQNENILLFLYPMFLLPFVLVDETSWIVPLDQLTELWDRG